MGMVGCFRALKKSEMETLQLDPERVLEFLDDDDSEDVYAIDVDKAWHAIHYMLTGSADGGPEPACLAILGGVEIGEDLGYGPPRLLNAEYVASVATLLESLTPDIFAKRYDPKAMDAAGIYPEIWERDGDEGLDYVLEWYQVLRTFYIDARGRHDGVLLWLS